ncbi:MAG: metallophosphoesterase family protein, partial [Cetobacterium sp.]
MKILVISDSHSQLDYIYDIIVQESPDSVICAGDHSTDAEAIAYAFPEIQFYIVKGNCDYYDTKHDNEMFVKIGNKFFFITHGHLYDAKKTYALLEKKGEELEA